MCVCDIIIPRCEYEVRCHLFGSLASLHWADGETETSGSREIRQVDVIRQPLIPPESEKEGKSERMREDPVYKTYSFDPVYISYLFDIVYISYLFDLVYISY